MTVPSAEDLLTTVRGLHPDTIDLSLDRIMTLLGDLGNPQETLPPVIHLAGTNGKGSTLAYLRAMFEADGKTVHAYTSPHLHKVWDGITVSGHVIEDSEFARLLSHVLTVNGPRPLTEFEALTVVAFMAFAQNPADVVLLETGLGGALDATNVINKPAVTVITPISMDHMDFLGHDQHAIARAKAGILKADTPCVLSRQLDSVNEVFRARARELDIPLLMESRDWRYQRTPEGLAFQGLHDPMALPAPGLAGDHQYGNAALAAAVTEVFFPFRLSASAISQGIAQARWQGRLETLDPARFGLSQGWEVWLDGGHNDQAGQILADHARTYWHDKPLYLICGMLANKDARAFLGHFKGLVEHMETLTIPDDPRSRPGDGLRQDAKDMGFSAAVAPSLDAALGRLQQQAIGRILICGSLSLAGKILTP